MGCIYEITFPDDSRYVGMTTQTLNHRLSEHRSKAKKFQRTPIQKAVAKFGLDKAWSSLVFFSDDVEFLCLLESEVIASRRLTKTVLNLADGGYGSQGVKIAVENKKATSDRLRGSMHFNSKITEKTVIAILKEFTAGVSKKKLSEIYGVSKSCISHICLNETWKHIDRDQFKSS